MTHDQQDSGREPLDRLLAELPRERAIERELWPDIRARLPIARPAIWQQTWPWALAASMLLAVLLWPATGPSISDMAAPPVADESNRSDSIKDPISAALAEIDAGSYEIEQALDLRPGDPHLTRQLLRLAHLRLQLSHMDPRIPTDARIPARPRLA